MEFYLDPFFSWESVSSDSKANEMYILFVILHSLWSGNNVLCSSSMGNVLLFVIHVLLSGMMAVVSSICLIALKILWCTLGELIGWVCFSGQISRVHNSNKTVVLYRCSGCMFVTAVTDGVFGIVILSFMFFIVVITLIFPLC